MTPTRFAEEVTRLRSNLVRNAVMKWGSMGEDVVQEAFLRAFKYLHTYDDTLSFNTWLISIINNVATHMLEHPVSACDIFDLVDEVTPERILQEKERLNRVVLLSEAQQRAIEAVLNNHPHSRSTLKRARKGMQDELGTD